MFSPQDLLRVASRDYILGNVSPEEQVGFIEDQITDPFNSGDTNYLKRLANTVSGQDVLDDYCQSFITKIQDVYPHLVIDTSEYNAHLIKLFMPIYKFFVKSAGQIMYIFIREFIFSSKNRKVLVGAYVNAKLPSYPKEQYGKKEYYILMTKLPQIIADIFEDELNLSKFINYVERGSDGPVYIDALKAALAQGYIVDNGVCKDMWKLYHKTDLFRRDQTKLERSISKNLILPYLEENKMLEIRLPQVEEVEETHTDDDNNGED